MGYICNLTIVSILQQFVDLGRMFTEGQVVTYISVCVCVCVCVYIYIHTHVYVYICMCVCVCIYIYIYIYDVNKSEMSAQRGPFRSLRVDKCSPDMEVRCEHVVQPDKASPH
jgi:hypothetical protein